jgi:hypothetical protein
MRKLSIVITALCVCTAFAVVASAQEKTLCERLGGTPAISAVVDSFAQKVLNAWCELTLTIERKVPSTCRIALSSPR